MRKLLPSRPYVFLFATFILGLVFFAAARLLFALSYTEKLQGVPLVDILTAFLIGIRFDQIPVLILLLPPLLILPWVTLRSKTARVTVITYLTVVFSPCFLTLLADIAFYKLSESRLNFLALDYLTFPKTTWHLIVTEPRFYLFITVWIVATIAFALLLRWLLRRTNNIPHRRSWAGQIVLFVVCLALTAVGVRGRLELSTINWGMAYFSKHHFVNQLGLNGVYTLGRALSEEGRDPRLSYLDEADRFSFVPFADALDSVRVMLHQDGDRWLDPGGTLRRITPGDTLPFGFQPNVVIVMMESWSGKNTGVLNELRDLSPRFDTLASGGILFTNFHAAGIRTNFGLAATLCSYPSIPGRSVMTRYNALHPFVSLSEILHDRGYFNAFAYGGDFVFDNMEGFFTTKNYDWFYGEDYFGRENVFAKWGVPDHIVFDRVSALTDSLPRPYQLTVLTLSNHEPWDLPDSSVRRYFDEADSSKKFNAFLYADYALGQFMEDMKQKPSFDSTIFVFTADHAHYDNAPLHIHPLNSHTPLLIYSPALLGDRPRIIGRFGGQVDILPTLMGLLGGEYTHESWGRDILRLEPDDSGYAIINVLNRVGWLEPDLFYYELIGRPGVLLDINEIKDTLRNIAEERPGDFARIQRRLHLYLQAAEQLSTPTGIE